MRNTTEDSMPDVGTRIRVLMVVAISTTSHTGPIARVVRSAGPAVVVCFEHIDSRRKRRRKRRRHGRIVASVSSRPPAHPMNSINTGLKTANHTAQYLS